MEVIQEVGLAFGGGGWGQRAMNLHRRGDGGAAVATASQRGGRGLLQGGPASTPDVVAVG